MKEATFLRTTSVQVECPHCGEYIDGWCGDPRGYEGACDFCGNKYKVHPEADIDFL